MRALAAAGLGFLLAVLWFDLMFDVQARRRSGDLVTEDARRSISTYYARVTTGASPMNRFVALSMLVTLTGIIGVLAREELPTWRGVSALGLAAGAIGLAGARTVRNAKRLGRMEGDAPAQSRLATQVLRDHVVCFAATSCALLVIVLPDV